MRRRKLEKSSQPQPQSKKEEPLKSLLLKRISSLIGAYEKECDKASHKPHFRAKVYYWIRVHILNDKDALTDSWLSVIDFTKISASKEQAQRVYEELQHVTWDAICRWYDWYEEARPKILADIQQGQYSASGTQPLDFAYHDQLSVVAEISSSSQTASSSRFGSEEEVSTQPGLLPEQESAPNPESESKPEQKPEPKPEQKRAPISEQKKLPESESKQAEKQRLMYEKERQEEAKQKSEQKRKQKQEAKQKSEQKRKQKLQQKQEAKQKQDLRQITDCCLLDAEIDGAASSSVELSTSLASPQTAQSKAVYEDRSRSLSQLFLSCPEEGVDKPRERSRRDKRGQKSSVSSTTSSASSSRSSTLLSKFAFDTSSIEAVAVVATRDFNALLEVFLRTFTMSVKCATALYMAQKSQVDAAITMLREAEKEIALGSGVPEHNLSLQILLGILLLKDRTLGDEGLAKLRELQTQHADPRLELIICIAYYYGIGTGKDANAVVTLLLEKAQDAAKSQTMRVETLCIFVASVIFVDISKYHQLAHKLLHEILQQESSNDWANYYLAGFCEQGAPSLSKDPQKAWELYMRVAKGNDREYSAFAKLRLVNMLLEDESCSNTKEAVHLLRTVKDSVCISYVLSEYERELNKVQSTGVQLTAQDKIAKLREAIRIALHCYRSMLELQSKYNCSLKLAQLLVRLRYISSPFVQKLYEAQVTDSMEDEGLTKHLMKELRDVEHRSGADSLHQDGCERFQAGEYGVALQKFHQAQAIMEDLCMLAKLESVIRHFANCLVLYSSQEMLDEFFAGSDKEINVRGSELFRSANRDVINDLLYTIISLVCHDQLVFVEGYPEGISRVTSALLCAITKCSDECSDEGYSGESYSKKLCKYFSEELTRQPVCPGSHQEVTLALPSSQPRLELIYDGTGKGKQPASDVSAAVAKRVTSVWSPLVQFTSVSAATNKESKKADADMQGVYMAGVAAFNECEFTRAHAYFLQVQRFAPITGEHHREALKLGMSCRILLSFERALNKFSVEGYVEQAVAIFLNFKKNPDFVKKILQASINLILKMVEGGCFPLGEFQDNIFERYIINCLLESTGQCCMKEPLSLKYIYQPWIDWCLAGLQNALERYISQQVSPKPSSSFSTGVSFFENAPQPESGANQTGSPANRVDEDTDSPSGNNGF